MPLPPGLILRAGTPGDAPFIQRLHEESIRGLGPRCYSRAEVESWASSLTPGGYVRAMTQGGESFLLAEPARNAGGRLAGFCSFTRDEIEGLYVHPRWARRGVGSALLVHAEAAIHAGGGRSVRVSASLIGQPLYEKHGYQIVGSRQHRTRTGLIVLIREMEKDLARPAARRRGRRRG
jgi:putative acetyltransferase